MPTRNGSRGSPTCFGRTAGASLRACLSVRFQGFTPSPQYRPSASSRLWPARPAALCLPDPCRLGSDSHGGEVFSGKLLEFLTQTGSKIREVLPNAWRPTAFRQASSLSCCDAAEASGRRPGRLTARVAALKPTVHGGDHAGPEQGKAPQGRKSTEPAI